MVVLAFHGLQLSWLWFSWSCSFLNWTEEALRVTEAVLGDVPVLSFKRRVCLKVLQDKQHSLNLI